MSISLNLSSHGYNIPGLVTCFSRVALLMGSLDLIIRCGPELRSRIDPLKTEILNRKIWYFTNPSLLFGVIGGCAQIIINGVQFKHYRDWYVSAPDSVIVLVGFIFMELDNSKCYINPFGKNDFCPILD